MTKHFQITLIVLVVMIFTGASLLVEGQPELHCPNFQLQFQPPSALSGIIVYQSKEDVLNRTSRFRMMDGTSLESVPFPVPEAGYEGLSPDGNWLLVSGQLDDTDENHQLWLYSIDGQRKVKVLSTSPRTYYGIYKPGYAYTFYIVSAEQKAVHVYPPTNYRRDVPVGVAPHQLLPQVE